MRYLKKHFQKLSNFYNKKRKIIIDIITIYLLLNSYNISFMINSVETSKEEKLKQLNQKLNELMQKKKIDIDKITKKT